MQQLPLFGSANGGRDHARPAGWYASGVGQRRDLACVDAAGARGMVSAARLAESPKLRADLDRFAHVPLTLDSGAFSGFCDLVTYRQILRAFEDRFEWTVNLDVLLFDGSEIVGVDAGASDTNWRRLRDAGHRCLYVYNVTDRRPLAEAAAEAFEEGDRLVCVGGLVPFLQRLRKQSGRKNGTGFVGEAAVVNALCRIGQDAYQTGVLLGSPVRLHLLGVGSPCVLRCVSPEPWYASADASTWINSARNGRRVSPDPFGVGYQEHPALPGAPARVLYRQDDTRRRRLDGEHERWRRPTSWHDLGVTSIRATLGCLSSRRVFDPLTDELGAEDDYDFALVTSIAKRFGCDDDSEAAAFLDEVMNWPSLEGLAYHALDDDPAESPRWPVVVERASPSYALAA